MTKLNISNAVYLGANKADRVYLGDKLVWIPTPPILDNFNRANGAMGSNWVGQGFAQNDAGPAILGNQVRRAAGQEYGSAAWHTLINGDAQISVDIADVTGSSAQMLLHLFLQPSDIANLNIYPAHSYKLRINAGTKTMQIITNTNYSVASDSAPQPGDTYLFLCKSGYLHAWHKSGGVWTRIQGGVGVGDSIPLPASPYTSGYIGFEMSEDNFTIDNFGGGAIL